MWEWAIRDVDRRAWRGVVREWIVKREEDSEGEYDWGWMVAGMEAVFVAVVVDMVMNSVRINQFVVLGQHLSLYSMISSAVRCSE